MDERAIAVPWYTKPTGYAVAWTFGNWLGPKFQRLENEGKFYVTGRYRALAAVECGNAMFVPNHASVPDDFFAAATLWPHYLYDDRFFIWSMPDRRTMQSAFRKKIAGKTFDLSGAGARLFRCVSIDRSDNEFSKRGVALAREVLKKGYTLIVHPEEGRTWGEGNQHKRLIPGPDGRVMREISWGLFLLANPETTFIPTWINMPNIDDMPPTRGVASVREPYRRLLGLEGEKYLPVSIHFGEPYRLPLSFNIRRRSEREAALVGLQWRILNA